jgi:hypothetical protein
MQVVPGTRAAGLPALFFVLMSTFRPVVSPGRAQRGERPGRDASLAHGHAVPEAAWRSTSVAVPATRAQDCADVFPCITSGEGVDD